MSSRSKGPPASVWQHYAMIVCRVEWPGCRIPRSGQPGPNAPRICYAQDNMPGESLVRPHGTAPRCRGIRRNTCRALFEAIARNLTPPNRIPNVCRVGVNHCFPYAVYQRSMRTFPTGRSLSPATVRPDTTGRGSFRAGAGTAPHRGLDLSRGQRVLQASSAWARTPAASRHRCNRAAESVTTMQPRSRCSQ